MCVCVCVSVLISFGFAAGSMSIDCILLKELLLRQPFMIIRHILCKFSFIGSVSLFLSYPASFSIPSELLLKFALVFTARQLPELNRYRKSCVRLSIAKIRRQKYLLRKKLRRLEGNERNQRKDGPRIS